MNTVLLKLLLVAALLGAASVFAQTNTTTGSASTTTMAPTTSTTVSTTTTAGQTTTSTTTMAPTTTTTTMMASSTTTTTMAAGSTTTMAPNTTTTMMAGNTTTTTMAGGSTTTMAPNTTEMATTTTTTMAPAPTTTMTTMAGATPTVTFAFTPGKDNATELKSKLATILKVSVDKIRVDGGQPGQTVTITFVGTAAESSQLFQQALNLDSAQLTSLGVSSVASAAATTTTAAPMTTAAPTTTTTTTTTTTVAPGSCGAFGFHDKCFENMGSCMEFDGMCKGKCSSLSMTDCGTNTDCEYETGRGCVPKCSAVVQAQKCWSSNSEAATGGCRWYNGKCDNKCSVYATSTTCGTNNRCMWLVSGSSSSCVGKCDIAVDYLTCAAFQECAWSYKTRKCVVPCHRNKVGSTCNADSMCEWDSSSNRCGVKCSAQKSTRDCLYNNCLWYKDQCSKHCYAITATSTNTTECDATPACEVGNATAGVYMCLPRCSTITNKYECAFAGVFGMFCSYTNNMCKDSCMNVKYLGGSRQCPTDGSCTGTTTATCERITSCAGFSQKDACQGSTSRCRWTGSMCTSTQCSAYSSSTCASQGGCLGYFASGTNKCLTKCTEIQTESGCMLSQECKWVGSTCKQACEVLKQNSTLCGQWAHCEMISNKMMKSCVPKCGDASDWMQCDQLGAVCMWSGKCQTRCGYLADKSTDCGGLFCKWNSMWEGCMVDETALALAAALAANIGLIAGCAAAGLVLIIIIVVLVTRKKKDAEYTSATDYRSGKGNHFDEPMQPQLQMPAVQGGYQQPQGVVL